MNYFFFLTLTYAWDALHRDLSYSLFEAGETWVNFSDLALFPLNELLDDLTGDIFF